MFDKVLLILLIILLPLGVLAVKLLSGNTNFNPSSKNTSEINQKITALIDQLNSQINQNRPPTSSLFNITGVIYATTSPTLQINGIAPKENLLIYLTVSEYLKDKLSSPLIVPARYAFKTNQGGNFSVDLDMSNYTHQVEIRLDQENAHHTIQFDLITGKQLL